MRGELVAIDLETTGLDPMQDQIIEVGAVRLVNGEITDEFSTYVDPAIPIPAYITHITGISTQDVLGAPRIDKVLPQIRDFVGDAPVIAHNISLDMGFLQQRHGILLENLRIDTYDLATVLLPGAPRYNLTSLTAQFDIRLEHAHRALDDARGAALLYWVLWQKMLTLPYGILREIVDAGRGLNWDASIVFESALQFVPPTQTFELQTNIFAPYAGQHQPLKPMDEVQLVNPDEIAAVVDDGGQVAQALPQYEHRTQQVEMAQAVATAFNEKRHLMVEAGTGTGKSLAYLVPALLWSARNHRHVVISTNTINLQEQLMENDIPALAAVMNMPLSAAVLKGRGNYLCPRRLATMRRRRPSGVIELRTLAKILVWLLESKTGDKGEISLRGPVENVVWQRLSAEDENCTLHRCQAAMAGACPFFKARKAAEAAHLVVVNHALLISDAVNGGRVLPDYKYVVVDEAHQLEDAVTNGLNFRIDQTALLRRLTELGGAGRGLLGEILNNLRGVIPDRDLSSLEQFITTIDEATNAMRVHIDVFFTQVMNLLNDIHKGRPADYVTLLRIVPAHRERSSFAQLQAAWGDLDEYFEGVSLAMRRLTKALNKVAQDYDGKEDLIASTDTAAQYLAEVRQQLVNFVLSPDSNAIYWLSLGQNQHELPTINVAPLHIGPMVEQHLWQSKDSVVLTSATLRTTENFDFIRERLYAETVKTMEVGSPFNYRESTLVYIPKDVPEPNDRQGYQRAVERTIIELAAALNGRVLALFTSYSQLRQTAQAITPRLALGGITVYDQSDGSSRQALVEGFKSTDKAVLLGTRSFWEGIDIPGEALSALVITRLPFAVPTDPIFAARSETYQDSFQDYAVPDAILRFRQGFGRLIRSRSDRGVVTVLDSRVVSKSYGASFIEALPDCTVRYGSLEGLIPATRDWLEH